MKFSISILAHRNVKMTDRCLGAVWTNSEFSEGDYELILTANGCPENAKMMQSLVKFPPCRKITAVVNEKNEGFISPNIHALSLAEGEYFVMLNSDTVVPWGWLEALRQPFLDDPKCAISGAQGCALNDDFLGHPSKNVEYIEGSCLMIRTAFARQIGLFDRKLVGAYGEDADLSLRVRQMGHTIHTVPIDIKHLGGATSSMVPQANAWLTKNLAYLKTKWADYLKTRTFHAPSNFTD